MITLSDLITPVTEDQFVERFLSTLETIGLRARSWRPGGTYRTILRVVAGTCASFTDEQSKFIRSGFLEFAETSWLTWVAFYVFGVERPEATFATGVVTLTNVGGGDYDFAAGTLRVYNSTTEKAYTNAAQVLLSPLGTVAADIVAVEIGADSSSSTGAIDEVQSEFEGQITVTNADPVVGSDAMPDDDLRQLCKDKRAGRSVFGPRGAYAYAIRSAKRDDGSTVDINRWSISASSSTGVVTMYVASPSGVPTDTDLAFVQANIEDLSRPDTVTASAAAATAHAISRTVTIWARKQAGLTAADIQALAELRILELNRSYPIGGIKKEGPESYFWADSLEGAIQKAHPAIYSVDGVGADEELTAGEVAVLSVTIDDVRIIDAEVH